MKQISKISVSLFLALIIAVSAAFSSFGASAQTFLTDAQATVLTASDFQDTGTKAYDRFGRILADMKNDGMPTPDSMLVGGDYTKLLFDNAIPGISQIRMHLTEVYPEADADSVVCIQGNHDNMISAFTKTGYYDMGAYNLYVINEDDFPWKQGDRAGAEDKIKNIGADLEKCLDSLIANQDHRPFIAMTHLPLHHTSRNSYGDNRYAAYIFEPLNKAGETLDIVFLFGHQHSGTYDDYIGGAVNFLKCGDTIKVPSLQKRGEDGFTQETLNFTYLNCGYIGYTNNSDSDTSTSALTLGALQICDDSLHFVKYSENGLFRTWDVERKTTSEPKERTSNPEMVDRAKWEKQNSFFMKLFEFYLMLVKLFSFSR